MYGPVVGVVLMNIKVVVPWKYPRKSDGKQTVWLTVAPVQNKE